MLRHRVERQKRSVRQNRGALNDKLVLEVIGCLKVKEQIGTEHNIH